ncbi:MAG TPA: CPBP family intramembrane glutamic endopeptidase [Terracidiphilus sp.]|nr:CPBP family intramembrane glutamic endopeptidase [Terracidiphilus sp.]
MPTPENAPTDTPDQKEASLAAPHCIAPAWHTLLLVAGILVLSFAGAKELTGQHASQINRMQTYAFTAGTEAVMLAWVYFGLRLRKVPFVSLLGDIPGNIRSIALDFGIALAFWMGSLFVLGTIGILWQIAEYAIQHHAFYAPGTTIAPDAAQQHTLHTLTALAPATAAQVAAWVLLCIMAGFTEEVVFRGYLQRQFTAWGRGALAYGVIFSALLFGFAHGYQGARNMLLLSFFGALFSLLTIFRRSLRPGIFAHAWQDLIAGLMLSALHAHHML